MVAIVALLQIAILSLVTLYDVFCYEKPKQIQIYRF